MFNSTIAAVSTPYGRGGISVIRISGEEALTVADRIFLPRSGHALSDCPARKAVFGDILPAGAHRREDAVDDGIAVLFPAPHSYTGENVVEISCHGGILLTEKILEAAFAAGAAQAGSGEFTKRAFVNGKLSLTEAEAVIDLIDAETEEKIKLARSQSNGVLSRKLKDLYSQLLALVSQTYVFADYPDEDLTDLAPGELQERLTDLQQEIERLIASYRTGHAINSGIYTVVAGKPNTGKSSLMNALLGRERAIVSAHAGTTRDYLEEKVPLGRVLLRLVDTAGLRAGEDEVEKIGIRRSWEALEQAELILALFDLSAPPDEEDREFLKKLPSLPGKKIAVLNKKDLLPAGGETDRLVALLPNGIFDATVCLSARTGEGLDRLKSLVEDFFIQGKIDYQSDAIVTSARQNAALHRAAEAIGRALEALREGFSPDVAGMDLEEAMAALGETDGRSVSGDIVDQVFHRFCVGK